MYTLCTHSKHARFSTLIIYRGKSIPEKPNAVQTMDTINKLKKNNEANNNSGNKKIVT
jgi:hypothetical protein